MLSQSLVEKKAKSSLPSDPERRPLLSSRVQAESPKKTGLETPVPSMGQILRAPAVRRVLVSYGFMALVAASVNAIFVLWLYTPLHSGGIGFSVSAILSYAVLSSFHVVCARPTHFMIAQTTQIGAALALLGIMTTSISVIAFPPIERRFGATALFKFGMVVQVIRILSNPTTAILYVLSY